MPIEIIVPRLGWSMEEGAFVAWLKKDGEFIRAGEPLFSIEGDKAIQEIESIDSGTLRIAPNGPNPGDPIRVGDVLGHLLAPQETAPESLPAREPGAISPPSPIETASLAPSAAVIQRTSEKASPRGHSPTISPRALRVAAELGLDWTRVTGTGRTGRIRERDIRAAAGSGPTSEPATRQSLPSFAAGPNPAVLVTGGCGFIGTWVIRELLACGLRVIVLDTGERPARWQRVIGPGSKNVLLIQGSLIDRQLLARTFAEHHVSHMIHLAALLTPACQADPFEGCRVNVLGSVALFEQIRASAPRIQGFSYASSVAVFGDEPDRASAATHDNSLPPTFYGAFKKSVEQIAAQYWRHFQIASVGIRPQVAYGPERDAGLTAGASLAARAAARGEAFSISYTGQAGYDYVEDVARALVRGALETPPGATLVDLPGEMADVNEVIAAIALAAPGAMTKLSANGPPVPAHSPVNPRFISDIYPDWKATPLIEGIRRTVEFYRIAGAD